MSKACTFLYAYYIFKSLPLEKEEMKSPRVSRRKEILKIRAEINAKETKETKAKKKILIYHLW